MREIVSEKIRQNFIVKSSPNLFWQEIHQKIRPQSRSSRPGFTQRTPNSVVFYSRLGKELFSQDFTSFLGY